MQDNHTPRVFMASCHPKQFYIVCWMERGVRKSFYSIGAGPQLSDCTKKDMIEDLRSLWYWENGANSFNAASLIPLKILQSKQPFRLFMLLLLELNFNFHRVQLLCQKFITMKTKSVCFLAKSWALITNPEGPQNWILTAAKKIKIK